MFTYFKKEKKNRKTENGQENGSFSHLSNFDFQFKNTKNTVNG